eukprot:NODE_1621_length_1468_cov_30.911205_g1463_i0.p1 GENE.NODE_1621_length_1468_cov_30.911205_g1463_i0~~NODE_1621_length_1468_cov_30.911205_g1463_i0.p1  ORF type:complete len:352 (-),score=53.51 NODE_1621_length_1468_cov_30.911205_g1463_i0:356-1411(-)
MPVTHDEVGVTVVRHIQDQARQSGGTGELTNLVMEIIVSCKLIASKVALAGIAEVLGHVDHQNVQGETVAILDEISNNAVLGRLLTSGVCSMVVSEENEEPQFPPPGHPGNKSKYIVAIDPLDGSSNVACDVPVGTIFGIYRRSNTDGPATEADLLKPLRSTLVFAGYVLYGPCTMFVYTSGQGVHGFTLDPSIGEFVLTHQDIVAPKFGKCYSANESNQSWWTEGVRRAIQYYKQSDKATCRPYWTRYVGSLVSDFHRNLLYGGIYMYPADTKDPSKPFGKLRLFYECAPLSFIAEAAGGRGSTGFANVMDLEPTSIHQRVPLYIGNAQDVTVCEEFVQGKRTDLTVEDL